MMAKVMYARDGGQPVRIPAGGIMLDGDLTCGAPGRGLVIFVHGSGSSRFSSRNRFVARALEDDGFGTLLADLLTPEEALLDERTAELRFDIPLLAERTVAMIDWVRAQRGMASLRIGFFGASTGAAAAVIAANERPDAAAAVVSRGGRVDLAGSALETMRTPLLMIVGGRDEPVLTYHRGVMPLLQCPYRFVTIPNATHLFEERGALESVADLAETWFERYLVS